MKVSELIDKLRGFDPELDAEVAYESISQPIEEVWIWEGNGQRLLLLGGNF